MALSNIKQRLQEFFEEGIWLWKPQNPILSQLVSALQVILLAIREYTNDRAGLRANALTFFSLLSIVPVLAMAFGIAKGFGLEELLQEKLRDLFQGHEAILERSLEFTHSLLESTKGGFMAGIGLVLLLWSVIKLLMNIEASFNDIWKVERARTPVRKFTDYFSIILIAPILLISTSSASIFVATQAQQLADGHGSLALVDDLAFWLIRLTPYLLICLLFIGLYMIMPNTRVSFKSAFFGGVVAGLSYAILQGLYLDFQVGVSRFNTIYGSFAALPLFMIWLQLSWQITIAGAEICFAHQNLGSYLQNSRHGKLSFFEQARLSIICYRACAERFLAGLPAQNATELSESTGIPATTTIYCLGKLEKAKLLLCTNDETWVPSSDPCRVGLASLFGSLGSLGDKGVAVDSEWSSLEKEWEEFLLKAAHGSAVSYGQQQEDRKG